MASRRRSRRQRVRAADYLALPACRSRATAMIIALQSQTPLHVHAGAAHAALPTSATHARDASGRDPTHHAAQSNHRSLATWRMAPTRLRATYCPRFIAFMAAMADAAKRVFGRSGGADAVDEGGKTAAGIPTMKAMIYGRSHCFAVPRLHKLHLQQLMQGCDIHAEYKEQREIWIGARKSREDRIFKRPPLSARTSPLRSTGTFKSPSTCRRLCGDLWIARRHHEPIFMLASADARGLRRRSEASVQTWPEAAVCVGTCQTQSRDAATGERASPAQRLAIDRAHPTRVLR